MASHSLPYNALVILLALSSIITGQTFTLPTAIPTTGCIGNAAGTATFSSKLAAKTGYETLKAGDYWNQAGAVWEFSTDTKGFVFGEPNIPGAGAGFGDAKAVPDAAIKALKLSEDKSTILLSAPSPSIGGSWDVMFAVNVPDKIESTTSEKPSASWKAGECKLSTFTDKPITCSGTVQQPTPATTTVCACPSDIMLDTLSGGDGDPCNSYVKDQGDLRVVTNFCQTPINKRDAMPAPTPAPEGPPVGAKFRPKPRHEVLQPRQDDGNININIIAKQACIAPVASKSDSGSANPTLASLCSNNAVSANKDSWTTYEVPKYMASLLSAAEPQIPTPTLPVDGAAVIHSDVNPPGAKCTYNSKCDSVSCNAVRDYNSGTEASIQRFLGYQAVANLNNYYYSVHEALFDAGTIGSLTSGDITTTFFTNPTPEATWMQIVGIFGPLLGMMSAMLGPIALASGALGVASGVVGIVGAIGTIENLQPVADKRFDEYSKLSDFIGDYLKGTDKGLEKAYDSTIGPDTPTFRWAGTDVAPDGSADQLGLFTDGTFADSDYSQGLSDDLLDKMISIITYKTINFAWVDSGVFIIFVPYGRDIKGPDGKMITSFSKDYCKNELEGKDMVGKLINCDAPGGMAAMHNAADGADSGNLKTPQGYDKGFEVLPGQKLDMMAAIAGSVNSWRAGDFNYDAGEAYKDAFNSDNGPSATQLKEIADLKIAQDTAGFFSIPVCQTYDLRFFPYAGSADPSKGTPCTACGSTVAVGGKDTGKKFMDAANDIVKKTLSKEGGTSCGGYYGNSCSSKCPEDLYTG